MKKDLLIGEIINALKIEDGYFTRGMIQESINDIKDQDYQKFFNLLMGDEHSYLKPLDRVAKVAKHFKGAKADSLLSEAHTMAKTFYDKIYAINNDMTTYSQANRDAVPNDRDFFTNFNYEKDIKGFTEQDVYVLKELGGGEWVMNIKFISNSKEAVEKIERIIKSAITAKYLKPKHEAIAHEVRKMLR